MGVYTTDVGVFNTHMGVSNTDVGVFNAPMGVYNTDVGVPNTRAGVLQHPHRCVSSQRARRDAIDRHQYGPGIGYEP